MRSIFVLLFLGLSIIYILFPSRAYLGDDLFYASAIEGGNLKDYWMFHSSHLLYGFTFWPLYKFLQLIRLSFRSIYYLTFLNAILGLVGVFLFYFFSSAFIKDRMAKIMATLFLAFSIGFWSQASGGGVYSLENVFLILSFFLIYKSIAVSGWRNVLIAGFIGGTATLYLNANILLCLIFCITHFIKTRSIRKESFMFLSTFFLIVGSAYLIVSFGIKGHTNIPEMLGWVFPSGIKDFTNYNLSLVLPYAAYAQFRAIFTGEAVKSLLLGKSIFSVVISFIFMLCSVPLFISICIILVKRFKLVWRGFRLLIIFSLVWVSSFVLFFSWFAAGNARFFTRNLIPLALIFGLYLQYLPKIKKIFVLFIIFLVLGNFFGQILPHSNPEYNENLQYSKLISNKIPQSSLVLMPGTGESNLGLYLGYFHQINCKSLRYELRDRKNKLASLIESYLANNRQVYFVSDLKKVSSAIFIKSIDERRPEYAIEAEMVQGFLRQNHYFLVPVAEFERNSNYRGNRIYRLLKE
jgi:hypothetical protein